MRRYTLQSFDIEMALAGRGKDIVFEKAQIGFLSGEIIMTNREYSGD